MDSQLRFIKWCMLDLEKKYINTLSDEVIYIRDININELSNIETKDYNYLIRMYKVLKESCYDKVEYIYPFWEKKSLKDEFFEFINIKKAINIYKKTSKNVEIQMKRLNSDY